MINNEVLAIICPAFVACLIIILTHAPLGIEVIKRGIIFIDLAVAQIAGLGIIFTNIILHKPNIFITQIIALSFAIIAGFIFRKIEISIPKQLEAIIGTAFIFSSSLAILLLANNPHGSKEMLDILSGEILFITWKKIFYHAPIYLFILSLWLLKPAVRKGLSFYLLFALAITSSVQLVGVYVVFASLILPALASLNYKNSYISAWIIGTISIIVGILLSICLDKPAGPILVLSFVLVTILCFLLKKIIPLNRI